MYPLYSKLGSCSLGGKTVATLGKEAAWNPDRFLGVETDRAWIWALLCLLKSVLFSCICIWHLQKILTDLQHCTLLWSRMSNANASCQLNFTIDFIIIIYFINNIFNLIDSLMYHNTAFSMTWKKSHCTYHCTGEQRFFLRKFLLRLHYIKR